MFQNQISESKSHLTRMATCSPRPICILYGIPSLYTQIIYFVASNDISTIIENRAHTIPVKDSELQFVPTVKRCNALLNPSFSSSYLMVNESFKLCL